MNEIVTWWRISFGEEEIQRIVESMRNECVSQGKVTAQFERDLEDFLEVEHVIAVSSGSTALLMALMAVGVGTGDEVILPNRTWISPAHAVCLLGAKVVLVDVEQERPIIDAEQIEAHITAKTKGIIPVHLNGRSADMIRIREIAQNHNLFVIEDAAQAIASRNHDGFLGTQSDIGCFSLSVAKIISTGQGGFAVTDNPELAKRMRAIRTHGVENVKDPECWVMPGFNFRFTDIQASIGIKQLQRLPERIKHLENIYTNYSKGLRETPFQLIPVNLEAGEVPIYNEYLVKNRVEWIQRLEVEGIETRPFYPDIDKAPYITKKKQDFPNSRQFGLKGIYLPSGPDQKNIDISTVIQTIESIHL
jgi:dTDP-4-amino-4,6-dideoxygalactose transaminase